MRRDYFRNGEKGPTKYHARVEFYFDQDGLVYYTSDHPNIEEISKKYHAQEEKNKRIFLGLDKE